MYLTYFPPLCEGEYCIKNKIHDIYYDFQDFKKYYGELRGAMLFLYKDDTQHTVSNIFILQQIAGSWFTNHINICMNN